MYDVRTIRRLALWGFAQWLVVGVLYLIYANPDGAEAWAEGWGGQLASALSHLSALSPFAVGEFLYGGIFAALTGWGVYSIRHLRSSGRQWRRALERVAFELGILTSAAAIAFFVTFGLSYHRPALAPRMGLTTPTPGLEELLPIANRLVERTNGAYLQVHGTPDLGEATVADLSAIDAALEASYATLLDRYPALPGGVDRPRPPARSIGVFNPAYRFRVAGFYAPLTGEAFTAGAMPDAFLIHVIAHEKGHQRLIGPEYEADFVGFLAAVHSEADMVRYGAWLEATREAIFAVADADPVQGQALYNRLLPGVHREFRALSEGRGTAAEQAIGGALNDAYLKANNQAEGIGSYRRSLELFVAWVEAHPEDFWK